MRFTSKYIAEILGQNKSLYGDATKIIKFLTKCKIHRIRQESRKGFTALHSAIQNWKAGPRFKCLLTRKNIKITGYFWGPNFNLITMEFSPVLVNKIVPFKGAGGVFGSRHSKSSFWTLFILGNKSYQLLFTASKNIVPSRSYGLSKLGSRL